MPRRPSGAYSEATVQQQVCDYLRLHYPGTLWRSDFASGLHLSMHQAVQHKRLQSGRAWPDLQIMEPGHFNYGEYHGLFIELKKAGVAIYKQDGTLRKDEHLEEQAAVLEELRRRGFAAEFCVGFDQARELIDAYLAGK
jgi:hypothetical protein